VIVHVISIKFRDPADVERVAARLEALPPKIAEIRRYEVGRDVVRSERSYDLVLVSEFDSLEALEAYRQHPDHVEVAAVIADTAEHVAVVDFER
jgi:hypothetical protein